ncbi:cytochrome c maturation protein CcmE [candidate division KSB1 bacterium]|nr:MAG: cytochrome c maturation protein CcmE [candidate division KSB1 bacterium]
MEGRRVRIFAAFAIVIGAISWVVASGFKDTMVYYKTVPELKAIGVEAEGRGFRVSGHVVPGTVVKSDDGLSIRFTIEEQGQQMPVSYHGIVPDTFKEGRRVCRAAIFDLRFEPHAAQIFCLNSSPAMGLF